MCFRYMKCNSICMSCSEQALWLWRVWIRTRRSYRQYSWWSVAQKKKSTKWSTMGLSILCQEAAFKWSLLPSAMPKLCYNHPTAMQYPITCPHQAASPTLCWGSGCPAYCPLSTAFQSLWSCLPPQPWWLNQADRIHCQNLQSLH